MESTEFKALFPHCHALGLEMIAGLGFDVDQVKEKLGAHFDMFMGGIGNVFSAGHRNWPADHPEENKRNAEVHCVFAGDLEKFLEAHV